MGLLILRDLRQSELRDKGALMTRDWDLRQLFAKTRDGELERNTAEKSVSLTRMIESGDFKIDLAERTVTLRGQELRLISEQFDVLVFLASHPQRLVKPRTILATSWDCESTSANGVLKSIDFPPQEARCCRTWQALASD
jgi:DNA-binding response OmpR family regulator